LGRVTIGLAVVDGSLGTVKAGVHDIPVLLRGLIQGT
jgi:hypothetical protein